MKPNQLSLIPKMMIGFSIVFCPSLTSAQDVSVVRASEPLPESMGVLGDSMSAGAMAGYRRQKRLPFADEIELLKDIWYAVKNRTKGAFDRRDLTWATGNNTESLVNSHYRRLLSMPKLSSSNVEAFNAAVSGEDSQQVLDFQLGELKQWTRMNFKQSFPDYVALFIGANDLCAKSVPEIRPIGSYYKNMTQIVDTILEQSPKTKLLVNSLPNAARLRAVSAGQKTLGGMKCESLRKVLQLCPTLTTLAVGETEKYVNQLLKDYNVLLESVVNSRRKIYGDRIRYVSNVYEIDFQANDLALDCFHPNDVGQNKLADTTWSSTWWAQ